MPKTISSPHAVDAKLKTSNILLAIQSSPEARNQFAATLGNSPDTDKIIKAFKEGNIEKFEQKLAEYFVKHHGQSTDLNTFANDAQELNSANEKISGFSKTIQEKEKYIAGKKDSISKIEDPETKEYQEKRLKPHLEDLAEAKEELPKAQTSQRDKISKFSAAPQSDMGDKFLEKISKKENIEKRISKGLQTADQKNSIGELMGLTSDQNQIQSLSSTRSALEQIEKNNMQLASNIGKEQGMNKEAMEDLTIKTSNKLEASDKGPAQVKEDLNHVEVDTMWDKVKNACKGAYQKVANLVSKVTGKLIADKPEDYKQVETQENSPVDNQSKDINRDPNSVSDIEMLDERPTIDMMDKDARKHMAMNQISQQDFSALSGTKISQQQESQSNASNIAQDQSQTKSNGMAM